MNLRLEKLSEDLAKEHFGFDRYNNSGEYSGFKENFAAGFDAAVKALNNESAEEILGSLITSQEPYALQAVYSRAVKYFQEKK